MWVILGLAESLGFLRRTQLHAVSSEAYKCESEILFQSLPSHSTFTRRMNRHFACMCSCEKMAESWPGMIFLIIFVRHEFILSTGIPFFGKMCGSTDSVFEARGSLYCGTVPQRCAEPLQ
jgi:hypothetical protein